jgi:hypothetical protein
MVFYYDQVPNGHVLLSSYESFQMSTPLGGRLFSSMCQHVMGSEMKGIGSPPILVLRTFYRQRATMKL